MRCAFLAAVVLGVLVAACAGAEVPLSPPGSDAWQPLAFPKIERHTRYTVNGTGPDAVVRAESDCSASAMITAADHIDLQVTPHLRWSWKVEEALDIADERAKAGDDFAARVYVMFEFDPERASLWQRARHAIATRIYGDLIPGEAINYVWTSREPAGNRWDNPFASTSKTVSLGGGPLSTWQSVEADVRGDYVSFFGHEPPPVLAVGIMTDSDNSCQHAVADYRNLRFVGPSSGDR